MTLAAPRTLYLFTLLTVLAHLGCAEDKTYCDRPLNCDDAAVTALDVSDAGHENAAPPPDGSAISGSMGGTGDVPQEYTLPGQPPQASGVPGAHVSPLDMLDAGTGTSSLSLDSLTDAGVATSSSNGAGPTTEVKSDAGSGPTAPSGNTSATTDVSPDASIPSTDEDTLDATPTDDIPDQSPTEDDADSCSATPNGGCDPLTSCIADEAETHCGACPTGYDGDGASGCLPLLLTLQPRPGELSPALDPTQTTYVVKIPSFRGSATLEVAVPDGLQVSVEGEDLGSGGTWESPLLKTGNTGVQIDVRLGGSILQSYIVTFARSDDVESVPRPAADPNGFGMGLAVSADGDTLAVGSYAKGASREEVYVYAHGETGWTESARLEGFEPTVADGFGWSIALSADGNTMVVGAKRENSGDPGIWTEGVFQDDGQSLTGAVHVFTRSGNAWTREAFIKASNAGNEDEFGAAIALSADGNWLVVSAPYEDSSSSGLGGNQTNDALTDSGAAYIFSRATGVWTQQAYLKASNPGAGASFGTVLALSSDSSTLAVGSENESSDGTGVGGTQTNADAPASGAAHVFTRSGLDWTQQAYIKASNAEEGDFFGSGLALSESGDRMAVGARGEGSAVEGDPKDNDAPGAGAVYVFSRADKVWTEQQYLKATNADAGDAFGGQVALSENGELLVVGAVTEASAARGIDGDPQNNDDQWCGAVYVFHTQDSFWTQEAYLKPPDESDSDPQNLGGALAISADGTRLFASADGWGGAVYAY